MPTITNGQRAEIRAVLARAAEYKSADELVDDLIEAALVGDSGTRYCVVAFEPKSSQMWAFGPYAAVTTARKAIESGTLASRMGTMGRIVPMSNPRVQRTREKTDPAPRAENQAPVTKRRRTKT